MGENQYKRIAENYYYSLNSRPLGQGTFGTVYRGKHYTGSDSEPVAIKVIFADTIREYSKFLDFFIREIQILAELKGKYVLNLNSVWRTLSKNLYIITDLCDGGSLEELLTKQKKLPLPAALKTLKQISKGFLEIESMLLRNSSGDRQMLMHRDIKPENILYHKGRAKISDFGFAKLIEFKSKDKKDRNTSVGTPDYMAPEILIGDPYSYKCDIWSMGAVTYEMIFGKLPWEGDYDIEKYDNMKTTPLQFPEVVPDDVKDLLRRMLEFEEEARIDWRGILEHPAISSKKRIEEKRA